MADEPKPKSESILPGRAAVPSEVVLSGSTSTPSPHAITPGKAPLRDGAETGQAPPSETELFLRWLAGAVLLVTFGWGFIGICAFLSRRFEFGVSLEPVLVVSAALSFVFLYVLEKDLWLSRFMGLRLGPHPSHLKETLFFWLLGIPGLMMCATADEKPAPAAAKAAPETDGTREIVETVVFVVVLVLLLKTFLAEAFVIPTGSMADTLLGYHKELTCERCGYHFLVNCSSEVDPQPGQNPSVVIGGFCPNCRFENRPFDRFRIQEGPPQ